MLPYLFAGVCSFLFLSLYERFRLPVLEVIASGILVYFSSSALSPEVASDCALMCASMDIDTLTKLI